MALDPLKVVAVAQLRTGAAQGVALTADDLSVLATDLKDSNLNDIRGGVLLCSVSAITVSDETYSIELVGRESDAGAYRTLATIAPDAVGLFAVSVPESAKQINYAIAVTGSAPSIECSLALVGTEMRVPSGGGVIAA